MMKKVYLTPQTAVLTYETLPLMMNSGVCSPDQDITYGGVDEEGERDPEARQLYEQYQVWEDHDAVDEGWY